MPELYKYIYYNLLIWGEKVKDLWVCESLNELPPDPPVMPKRYFKLSGGGKGYIGMYDDVWMGRPLREYFKR